MAVRRASRGLQVTRVVMAAVLLTTGVLAAAAGSWLLAALLLAAAVGAVLAFRRGEWDPEQAKRAGRDYALPRLIGAGVGLVLFLVAAAVGLLD